MTKAWFQLEPSPDPSNETAEQVFADAGGGKIMDANTVAKTREIDNCLIEATFTLQK
jgi:hypothetical protein